MENWCPSLLTGVVPSATYLGPQVYLGMSVIKDLGSFVHLAKLRRYSMLHELRKSWRLIPPLLSIVIQFVDIIIQRFSLSIGG